MLGTVIIQPVLEIAPQDFLWPVEAAGQVLELLSIYPPLVVDRASWF